MSTSTRLLSANPWAAPPTNDLIDHFGSIPPPTPEQFTAARLAVCARALDVEDARALLSMLGLGEAS